MENNLICCRVTEKAIQDRLYYNTKDLFKVIFSSLNNLEKISFSRLAELVQEGKLAIFPVYAKCEVREIKSYLEMGFTCYLLEYKQYKEFEKYYKSL